MSIPCLECGKPWGVILDRGEEPSPENIAAGRAELTEDLREQWEADYEPEQLANVDWDLFPPVTAYKVVFCTTGLWDFCERVYGDAMFEPDAWYPLDQVDIPRWMLKGRKTRWAVRWDCCDIGHPIAYPRAPALRETT